MPLAGAWSHSIEWWPMGRPDCISIKPMPPDFSTRACAHQFWISSLASRLRLPAATACWKFKSEFKRVPK